MKSCMTIMINILFIFIMLCSLSCSVDQKRKDGEAESRKTALSLAFPNKIQYAPFIIGISRGIFERHGLKITHVAGVGGIDAAEAVLAGQADAGAMGDAPASILLSRCSECRILFGFMQRGIYKDSSVVEGLGKTATFLNSRGLIRAVPDIKKAAVWPHQERIIKR